MNANVFLTPEESESGNQTLENGIHEESEEMSIDQDPQFNIDELNCQFMMTQFAIGGKQMMENSQEDSLTQTTHIPSSLMNSYSLTGQNSGALNGQIMHNNSHQDQKTRHPPSIIAWIGNKK